MELGEMGPPTKPAEQNVRSSIISSINYLPLLLSCSTFPLSSPGRSTTMGSSHELQYYYSQTLSLPRQYYCPVVVRWWWADFSENPKLEQIPNTWAWEIRGKQCPYMGPCPEIGLATATATGVWYFKVQGDTDKTGLLYTYYCRVNTGTHRIRL